MSTNPFSTPAPASGGVSWADFNGALLIIEPLSVEQGIKTTFGDTEAVRANVHVVDGPRANEVHNDTLVFPTILRSQLRSKIGEKVLGRVGQGQAKPGQSAPWILQEAEPADIQAGTEYLNRQQSSQFAAPAQQAAPAGTPPF